MRSGWLAGAMIVWFCFHHGNAAAQLDEVRFGRDVAPILQQHCFSCHAEKAEGDLRLDSPEGFAAGGHSGNSILGTTPDDSELLLRVVSNSDGYRMPKTGPRLSDSEVSTLRKWIQQGAKWDALKNPSTPSSSTAKSNADDTSQAATSWVEQLAVWYGQFSEALKRPSWKYLLCSGLVFFGVAIAVYMIRNFESPSARKARKQSNGETHAGDPGRWMRRGFLLLFVSLACYTAFLFGRVQEFETAQREGNLLGTETQAKRSGQPELIISYDNLVEPPYPMHPRRLGGTYYRGNDERSEQLFNGGFYRTATIDLFLVDEKGNRLETGQALTGDASIELTIKLAPNATQELFSERVWSTTYLKHYPVLSKADGSVQKDSPERMDFEIVEPNRCWQKRIPVFKAKDATNPNDPSGNETVTGMIYLYYGAQDFGAQVGRVHFGIKYSISLVDGVLSNESELWMGSIYNLNGRVLVPSEGQILLDRWFDFRPIPVIEGDPSEDPELLGLPEHQQNR